MQDATARDIHGLRNRSLKEIVVKASEKENYRQSLHSLSAARDIRSGSRFCEKIAMTMGSPLTNEVLSFFLITCDSSNSSNLFPCRAQCQPYH